MPDRSQDPPSPEAESLFAEWRARSQEPADIEALCHEHPEHALALRKLHEEWNRVLSLMQRAGFGTAADHGHSFAERLKGQYGSGVDPAISLEGEDKDESSPPTSELLKRLSEHGLRRSRYELRGEIARGGMGAILKIWDEDLRRSLAMKVILGKGESSTEGDTPPVDKRLLARFLEEAQVTGQLDHPGIVPVHELGLDADGRVYFTMKLVKGRDLKAIFDLAFEEKEGWNETRALGVLLRVCEAMAYAHAKGVIHRDLKPANVMVGGFGEVYVMDWGLARVLGRADPHDLRIQPDGTTSVKTERGAEREDAPDSPLFTMDGDVVGTPAYMPPEQAVGAVARLSPRSDVYALGAMLYHLLARQMPYVPSGVRMTNRMVLMHVQSGPPPGLASLRKDVPAELVAIVERAMAREPEQRYRDTLGLADDMRAYLEHRVVSAYETGAWAETKKWVQRNKGLAASLVVVILALAGGLTTSLTFKARADQRSADLQEANTTIHARNAELAEATIKAQNGERSAMESAALARQARSEADERASEARASLYAAAIIGAQVARRSNEPLNVRRLLDSAPEELRNWEWRYLDAVSDASLSVLPGHAASFSPDGSRIITASLNGQVRVWDAISARELTRLEGVARGVSSVAVSPDGARIVTTSLSDVARLWDARTGKELAQLQGQREVRSASFSPDGARIVTAARDRTARVWDASDGTELLRLVGHMSTVYSADFSPSGARIVTASDDKTARVWDASSGRELARLEGHTKWVSSASFGDDAHIVTASGDDTARVWDASSGQELARLEVHEGHGGGIASASFSPNGLRILTHSSEGTAVVWDARSGKELVKLEGHATGVTSSSFSPDGLRIVTASTDNSARLWDAVSGKELARLDGHTDVVNSATFNPDGTRILTASFDDTARVWDAASGEECARFEGRWANVGDSLIVAALRDKDARIWDPARCREVALLEGHTARVNSTCIRRDGARILTASDDKTARLWDATTGKELERFVGHAGDVTSACFSPDGMRIATASRDNTARVWDAASGKELTRMLGHTGDVTFVCFRPDGACIATAGDDNSTRVWDAASGKELVRFEGNAKGPSSACFSPDGARIVTASYDPDSHVWDARTGEELARLIGHTTTVTAATFNPDGTRIVTASMDNTVRVWDAADGTELLRLDQDDWVTCVAFSPDGSRLVTSGNAVRVWDAVPYRVRHVGH